ncbi:hypothetical protein AAKU55_000675 [Oxalobacteraceae bacterium GrIS 1.11]
MSQISATRRAEHGAGMAADESYGEIIGPQAPERSRAVMRQDLSPGEELASMLPGALESQAALQPLTRFLGAPLTVANPAWSRDPLPGMRALQKTLVEYSLTLEQGARADTMAAIVVVERAVQLRLRLQQMDVRPHEMDEAGIDGVAA